MARIKETFDSRAWFMLECDDPDCERRFDDSQWYAYEDDLLADAKDDGWQILYKDDHPRRIRHRTEEEPLSFSPWLKTGGLKTCAADRYEAETWLDKQIGEDE